MYKKCKQSPVAVTSINNIHDKLPRRKHLCSFFKLIKAFILNGTVSQIIEAIALTLILPPVQL